MAYTDREDLNYLGELFLVGANQTPFLNQIGGFAGGRTKITRSFQFPLASTYAQENSSQPAITEAESVSSNTATTVTRSQDLNTVQIFQETVEVSYAKQSTHGEISGLASVDTTAGQQVKNELEFQKMTRLKQISKDAEYSFLNGSYQVASDSTTAAKTRGILTGITTNAVAAGSATLTKAMIDELVKDMFDNGALFENMWMYVNSFQKQKISDIYGYAVESRTVGGKNIMTIQTDFCEINVQVAPNIPAASLGLFDMNYIYPVACPVPETEDTVGGTVFYDPLNKVAASTKGQMYGQLGIDYGPEEFHGKITGLATS